MRNFLVKTLTFLILPFSANAQTVLSSQPIEQLRIDTNKLIPIMFSEYLAYKFENYLDNDSTFELVTPAHLPTGKYVAFYKNDSTLLALEVTNYNGEKNGTQREFYLNGNQKISQDFVNGEMNGEYIYYYRFPASQNCRYEQRKHGLLNGAYRLYCPNGQKNTIGQGKNGVEYGTWLRWDCDNGKLIFKWRYKNGKMVFSKKFRN